jgi:hypothetical protein
VPNRIFGDKAEYPEGTYFTTRIEASHAGVHRPTQSGISGSAHEGADSIVVSGGYEDDRDLGYEIWYIGNGGRDPETGEQVADQELTNGNLALIFSSQHDLPVRVVRGANSHSQYAPKAGYRYDGLYKVEEYRQQQGKSGHLVWCFRLKKIDTNTAPWKTTPPGHLLAKAAKNALSARPSAKQKIKPTLSKPAKDAATLIPRANQPYTPALAKFKVGDKVEHPAFGEGVISAIAPSGQEDQIVTVDFNRLGNKKLLAGKANLNRISREEPNNP